MIVVTAPTGAIGSKALAELVARDADVRVVARDPSRLPAGIIDRVDVVSGSHGEESVAKEAFNDADAVLWIVPPDPRASSPRSAYIDFSRPVVELLRGRQDVQVVATSALGRGWPEEAGMSSACHAMDAMFEASGVSYRSLALPSFMDNMLLQVRAIALRGEFSSPMPGDRRAPMCATRDIASVAVEFLLDPTWRGVGTVPVLGPEDLSFTDMARVMSDVLGREVRFKQVPEQLYLQRLVERGMSEPMARGLLDMIVAKGRGLDSREPRTDEATTPTTFVQWCEEELAPAVDAVTHQRAR